MFDWQSYWSLEGCAGRRLRNPNEVHVLLCAVAPHVPVDMIAHYAVDGAGEVDLNIAPALITVLPGVAETLEHYVSDGGSFRPVIWRVCMTSMIFVVPGGYPAKLQAHGRMWVSRRSTHCANETTGSGTATWSTPRARSWPASSIPKVHAGSPPGVATPTQAICASPSTISAPARPTCRHPLDEWAWMPLRNRERIRPSAPRKSRNLSVHMPMTVNTLCVPHQQRNTDKRLCASELSTAVRSRCRVALHRRCDRTLAGRRQRHQTIWLVRVSGDALNASPSGEYRRVGEVILARSKSARSSPVSVVSKTAIGHPRQHYLRRRWTMRNPSIGYRAHRCQTNVSLDAQHEHARDSSISTAAVVTAGALGMPSMKSAAAAEISLDNLRRHGWKRCVNSCDEPAHAAKLDDFRADHHDSGVGGAPCS